MGECVSGQCDATSAEKSYRIHSCFANFDALAVVSSQRVSGRKACVMSVDRPTIVGPTSPEGFIELQSHAGRHVASAGMKSVAADDVISFWQEAGRPMWFAKDANFDRRFRERFLSVHEAAARGELNDWATTPNGALALLILLDQFPRNAFRGTARMYASDARACDAAKRAIAAGHDMQIEGELRGFFYLPFCHSEELADQERAVELFQQFRESSARAAERHRDIIKRFGRFPHRNSILGRTMTAEEQVYLDQGGFAG
jgi:uncharacterized protein (DUF924 family)